MSNNLSITLGHCSDKGVKPVNQDFHGALIPEGRALVSKGISLVLADGISSSSVSQEAAETAVKSFLTDYYCTSDAWRVKSAASRVISATNSWLFAQTKSSQHAHDLDRGYVCTLSAMVLKARKAHLFHVGDARIYRVSGEGLEQLTKDHRVVLSSVESYLGRALGMAEHVEIDYHSASLSVGDIFVMATDGVYEFAPDRFIATACQGDDLNDAARKIVDEALARGSSDNCTVQILRINALPAVDAAGVLDEAESLEPAPILEPPCRFDGYDILRTLHSNSRSHIYLAKDPNTGKRFALKVPSVDLRDQRSYLRRLFLEEWIARRVASAHVLKAGQQRTRSHLYTITEYVEGQTLRQWMRDNPQPELDEVRDIVEQIVKGLRAFHRREMLHQDLRPENVMIDRDGTVKIIDFGSASVAGVAETGVLQSDNHILGTAQYSAPEYFVGEAPTPRSDMFSLGVIAYEMLTGELPYGAKVSRAMTARAQSRLHYRSANTRKDHIPSWVDSALARATKIDPRQRYETMSEFLADLRRPNRAFVNSVKMPLIQRNPLLFWQVLSVTLGMLLVVAVGKY